MWRFLLVVILSAGVGSFAGTLLCFGISDGPSLVFSLSIFTMLFSVPGAMMLVGLRASLGEYSFTPILLNAVTAAAGAFIGGLVLAALFVQPLLGFKFGSLYGLATAGALILFETLLAASRRLG